MNIDTYKNLVVGSKVWHPKTGTVVISRTYVKVDWDEFKANYKTDLNIRPEDCEYTYSFETEDGRYSKIQDSDVKEMILQND